MSSRTCWWALAALALSMLTIGLDTTVLSVALPTLANDLGASTAQLQWFSTCYTLVLAALLLPAGALGDRYGYKKLLLLALLIFGAASVWCAYSGNAGMLIAARTTLGVGAAMMIPLSMAVLPSIFPDATERARALTIWVTSTAVGLPLGPILGGWLLAHAWWGAIFVINVPLVVVGFAAVAAFVPESRAARSHPLDLIGVALSSAGLTALTFGFIRTGQESWTDDVALSAIAGGVVLLVAFVGWQTLARFPLVDLNLFSNKDFRWATFFLTMMGFPMFGILFALPQYFQAVQGESTLGTGLRLLPMIGGLLLGTRVVDAVANRVAAGTVIATGFAVSSASLAGAALTNVHTPFVVVTVWLMALGAGMGLVLPSAMNTALGALDAERTGAGSALVQALRQAGGTIGVALLGTVLNAGYRGALPALHEPTAKSLAQESVSAGVNVAHATGSTELLEAVKAAFMHGMSSMMWTSAVLAGVLTAVAALVLRAPRVGGRSRGRHHADPRRSRVFPDAIHARELLHAGD